jgi:hypothetical protein
MSKEINEIQRHVGDYPFPMIDIEKTRKNITNMNLKEKEDLLKKVQNQIQ